MYTPKPGDFGVVTIHGTVGKLIRFGQWLIGGDDADYEHAFVFVGGTANDSSDGIVEAEPNGARLGHLSEYNPNEIAWYKCPADKGSDIAVKAICLVGTPYSFLDYVAIAFHHNWLTRHTLGKLVDDYVSSTKHMICSQLVDEAYKRAGVQLFSDNRLPGDVDPDDLYQLIEKQRGDI